MISNIRTAKEIIVQLNYILDSRQKRKAVGILLVIIISSALELVGITAILPFIQAVVSPEEVWQNVYVQRLASAIGIKSSNELLLLFGLVLIFIYIFKNIIVLLSNYIQYDYSACVQKELSIRMLKSYMSRPYSYYLDVNSAEILRGCGTDVNGVFNILSFIFSIISELLVVSMISIYVIYTDAFIALCTLMVMFSVMLGIVVFFKPIVKQSGKKNIEVSTEKYKTVYQAVNGIKEIYVMQRKEYFVDEYEMISENARKVQRTYEFISNSPDRIIEGICVSALIGIVCIRLMMSVDMVDFIPKLGAFAMAAFKILPSVGKISSRMTGIIYHRPMLENVYDIMKEAAEYEALHEDYAVRHGLSKEADQHHFDRELVVNHITWKYKNQVKPVLENTALTIRKGESIALIGASGAGKTTLADVILGLLHPQQGTIEMDGTDVYAIPKTWAHIIGYVPQSVFLIDDTIRSNVAFGLKDQEIRDMDIWDALERAQLKDFVQGLPDDLDTIVGERGIKFSGGQKQRIAIARALYNRPEILVLDEATAALDNETEAAVMESIDALQGQITMIIVAHRLTTIRNCDRIYEIKDGRTIEQRKEEVLL